MGAGTAVEKSPVARAFALCVSYLTFMHAELYQVSSKSSDFQRVIARFLAWETQLPTTSAHSTEKPSINSVALSERYRAHKKACIRLMGGAD